LMVFCGPLFDMHPRYIHFKTLLMDLFRGQTVDRMELDGLQHVICVSAGEQVHDPSSVVEDLPSLLFRVYIIKSRKVTGSKIPKVELEEMGPRMDLKLGRWQEANEDTMSQALRKPKDTTVVCVIGNSSNARSKRRRMLRLIPLEISSEEFMLASKISGNYKRGK